MKSVDRSWAVVRKGALGLETAGAGLI